VKIIIIDDSREYMALVRRMLASAIPDVEVTEYDPEQQGKPGPEFAWPLYDVLLLDYRLGVKENGLDWLAEYRRVPGFPPTVLMTGVGDEYVAARAIKTGAFEYLRKPDLTSEKLAHAVNAAFAERQCRRPELDTTVKETLAHDAALFRQIKACGRKPDGSKIGYRFVRLIGQGASSRVYLAERQHDRTMLVLKIIDVMNIKQPQVLRRFIQEAEMIAEIESPYVVRFLDHGFTKEYGYIAMEFFPRGDLKQRLEVGVSLSNALRYFTSLCRGLEAIHAAGIIHRDLKPGNIMFRADDSLALSDFGISKRLGDTSEMTKAGSVLGTPNYLSPEQALGRKVDHRTDFYSAGVILFELLAGRKPYRADSAAALVYQHVHAEIPQLPEPLAQFQPLIQRLLAKPATDRYEHAAQIIADVEPFMEELVATA
jgi:FixJ family two-component response regulator/tRNA A-37 threonylcarbamoyl transferase component Bud32